MLFLAWLALGALLTANDNDLARAKELYFSAAYDEALSALDGLKITDLSSAEAIEVSEYRMFCLLALDRRKEAEESIETIVKANPFYQPSESQVSPRILAVFQDVRRSLLPDVLQRSFGEARAAFDRRDPQATEQFDRVLALLAVADVSRVAAWQDLRAAAIGFRDLSTAAGFIPIVPAPSPPARSSDSDLTPAVQSASQPGQAAANAQVGSPPSSTGTPSVPRSSPPARPSDSDLARPAAQPAAEPGQAPVNAHVGTPPSPTGPPGVSRSSLSAKSSDSDLARPAAQPAAEPGQAPVNAKLGAPSSPTGPPSVSRSSPPAKPSDSDLTRPAAQPASGPVQAPVTAHLGTPPSPTPTGPLSSPPAKPSDSDLTRPAAQPASGPAQAPVNAHLGTPSSPTPAAPPSVSRPSPPAKPSDSDVTRSGAQPAPAPGRAPVNAPLATPLSPAGTPTSTEATSAVQTVLRQFQRAYSDLNASVAKAVWPSVDEKTLSRAFDQLEQQDLTFSSCQITFAGVLALAACEGHSSYVPKVGSKTARLVPRRWTFSLETAEGEWIIKTVEFR